MYFSYASLCKQTQFQYVFRWYMLLLVGYIFHQVLDSYSPAPVSSLVLLSTEVIHISSPGPASLRVPVHAHIHINTYILGIHKHKGAFGVGLQIGFHFITSCLQFSFPLSIHKRTLLPKV